MLRRSLIIFLLLGNLTVPMHAGRHPGRPAAAMKSEWPGNGWKIILGLAGLGVAGTFYSIHDGLKESTEPLPAQLCKALENQQSWLFPYYLSGKIAEQKLLQIADKKGTKRSQLYKEAVEYAEQKYDAKTAVVLRKRFEDQKNLESFFSLQNIEAKPTVHTAPKPPKPNGTTAPIVITGVQPENFEPKKYDRKTVLGYCALTAAVVGATAYRLATKLARRGLPLTSTDRETALNVHINDLNEEIDRLNREIGGLQGQERTLRRHLHQANDQRDGLQEQYDGANVRAIAAEIARNNLQRERTAANLQAQLAQAQRNNLQTEVDGLMNRMRDINDQLRDATRARDRMQAERDAALQDLANRPQNNNASNIEIEEKKNAVQAPEECPACLDNVLDDSAINLHAGDVPHRICRSCVSSFFKNNTLCLTCRLNLDTPAARTFINNQMSKTL